MGLKARISRPIKIPTTPDRGGLCEEGVYNSGGMIPSVVWVCAQRCSSGRIIGGVIIVREQKEDQGPCCEQLTFRIIGGGANASPAPLLPTGLL